MGTTLANRQKQRHETLGWCVYIFYCAEGQPIYVGQTVDIPRRILQHRSEAEWWEQVRNIEVRWVPSELEARQLEKRLIPVAARQRLLALGENVANKASNTYQGVG